MIRETVSDQVAPRSRALRRGAPKPIPGGDPRAVQEETSPQARSRRRSALLAGIGPPMLWSTPGGVDLYPRNFAHVAPGHRFLVGAICVELNSANSSSSRLRLAANMTWRCIRSVMA